MSIERADLVVETTDILDCHLLAQLSAEWNIIHTAEAEGEVNRVAVVHAFVAADSDSLVELAGLGLDRGRKRSGGGEESSDEDLGEHLGGGLKVVQREKVGDDCEVSVDSWICWRAG